MEPQRPPLFRKDAVEAASGTQFGETLRTHWRGVAAFTIVAAAIVVALVIMAISVEYSPVFRVRSYTDTQGGLVRLKAPVDGRITTIRVRAGAKVATGDILAILRSDKVGADGISENDSLRPRLEAERQMIKREIDALRSDSEVSREMLDRRISGLSTEVAALRRDMLAGEVLLRSLEGQYERTAALAKEGHITSMQAAQKRDEVTTQEGRVATSKAALARAERDIALAEAEKRGIGPKLSTLIEARMRASSELERMIIQGEAAGQQILRAPKDGTIALAISAEGQSVAAGDPLFTLVPSADPLVMRILLPPAAAAGARPGATVKIAFAAYPQEKFGLFSACIDSVGESPNLPGDGALTVEADEPVFLAVAHFPITPSLVSGEPLPLKPGMLADAFVQRDRRSIFEWMIEPIFRGFEDESRRASQSSTQGIR